MQNDDDLQERFQQLARDDTSAAPQFSATLAAAKRRAKGSSTRRSRFSAGKFVAAGASLVGVAVVLAIGLVLGTNTGYASALAESQRQRTEIVSNTLVISNRLADLRADLARARSALAQRALYSGSTLREPLLATDAELERMQGALHQIELKVAQNNNVGGASAAFTLNRSPIKSAFALTCDALSFASPSPTNTAESAGGVAIIELPAATVKSTENFGAILNVRELPGGKLLVNDGRRRQLKLFEPNLSASTTVLDSARGGSHFYGANAQAFTAYVGDSTLFPNFALQTVAVLDPHGVIVRSTPLPAGTLLRYMRHGGSDSAGRIIMTGDPAITRHSAPGGIPPAIADSMPILRADLAQHRTDTLAYVWRPTSRFDGRRRNGVVMSAFAPDVFKAMDDWAVMTDGSIAIVKGHDYHIEFIRPDGTKVSSPKLPFDWRPLDDGDKQRVIDDAQAEFIAAARSNTLGLNIDMVINWAPQRATKTEFPSSVERINADIDTVGALYTEGIMGPVLLLPRARSMLDEVFDFYPPVRNGSVLADRDNHLWIATNSRDSKSGNLVYDVVSNQGELLKRVRVPTGRTIVGFGRDGVVYLSSGNATTGFTIERTRLPIATLETGK